MGAFKLGKMTFGSLFKKPETVLYPLQTKPQPAGLKGHIVVDADACILCGMCDRNCTTDCITVDKQERYWQINPFNCIQCGYCITVCPKKCLHMDPNYWAASVAQEAQRFAISVQGAQKQGGPAAQKAEPAAQAAVAPASAAAPAPAAAPTPAVSATAPSVRDEQLATLISRLDPDKAKIVESALAR